MNEDKGQVSYFAHSNHRRPFRTFGIKQADRLSHVYVIGKTGAGKTTLLQTLIAQDIALGRGCALIDPHGDFVERLAAWIPEHRAKEVIYLDVPDPAQPFGYNPFARVSAGLRPLVVSGLLDVFKRCGMTPGERAWSTFCAMRSSRFSTSRPQLSPISCCCSRTRAFD